MDALDVKINYLLERLPAYKLKLSEQYIDKIHIYGTVESELYMNISVLGASLKLSFLGDNIRLELYKRLSKLLSSLGYVKGIPEYDLPKNEDEMQYTYYYGAGIPDETPANLQLNLDSDFSISGTKEYYFDANAQVLYFCYPSSLGPVKTIKDKNGFDVTDGWELRVETFTFPSGTESYHVMELKNITTATDFLLSFELF